MIFAQFQNMVSALLLILITYIDILLHNGSKSNNQRNFGVQFDRSGGSQLEC
jgi:hypothetical protein